MFSSEPVVSVSKATIIQEDKPILTGVDFSMEKGEFVFLIGRTGGGKSSLLKTIYA
ncbi:MAG: ATP-binding cassette domain-containing protein, partial [Cyclobacteriaceae bacterium]|nr:ATP-binding cassette domain-containing protein [Cyclobacteriaceae bacterium]